jgi:glucose-1-phosphate adenylyltransferase
MRIVFHPPVPRGRPYRGTADAVRRNLRLLSSTHAPKDVLILSGDHVYDMDYGALLAFHRSTGADLTVATTMVHVSEAWRFGILECPDGARVERFWEKPQFPERLLGPNMEFLRSSMGVYVFRADALRAVLAETTGAELGTDFGGDIVPRMVEGGRVYAYDFIDDVGLPRYWRDVGTIGAYFEAHMDLLTSSRRFELRIPADFGHRSPLGRVLWHDAALSLMTRRCHLRGYCRRVVMSDGARVEEGAHVEEAVLLDGAVVESGAFVRRAIIDQQARVRRDAIVDGGAGLAVIPAHTETEGTTREPIPWESLDTMITERKELGCGQSA